MAVLRRPDTAQKKDPWRGHWTQGEGVDLSPAWRRNHATRLATLIQIVAFTKIPANVTNLSHCGWREEACGHKRLNKLIEIKLPDLPE